MNRRSVLLAGTTGLFAAIAGCSGAGDDWNQPGADDSDDNDERRDGDDGDGDGRTDGTTDDQDGNDDTDDEDTDPTEAYADEEDTTPLEFLKTYYQTFGTGDVDGLNELLHADLPGQATPMVVPGDSVELADLEVEVLGTTVDESAFGFAPIPDDESILHVEATAAFAGDEQDTKREDLVLVTEDGRWRLWDLVSRLYHLQVLETTGLTGIVGAEGEIHELRLGVTRTSESGPVDLSEVNIIEYIAGDVMATFNVGEIDGEPATGHSHPEDVKPDVVEHDRGHPQDLFGVSVVTASEPDNLFITDESDIYQIVIDTSGGEALPPLTPGEQLRMTLRTGSAFDTPPLEREIPDLEAVPVGEEVEI